MDLHRRQRQVLGDVGVLMVSASSTVLPLTHSVTSELEAIAEPAAEGLELGVLDQAVGADLDLQLHDVAAGRRADQTGADILGVLSSDPMLRGFS